MSPAPFRVMTSEAIQASLDRLWAGFGARVRDERLSRQWTTRRLAHEAGVSRTLVYLVERGDATSLEACARLAAALALRLELELSDWRRRSTKPDRAADLVHSAMGEFEAAHLRALRLRVAVDEPYQHYQFAGRADVLAWPDGGGRLLHLENRTRFTDLQAAAGSFNAKRAYLADSIAGRLGLGRLESVTHVIVALWSSEVLHVLRRGGRPCEPYARIRWTHSMRGGPAGHRPGESRAPWSCSIRSPVRGRHVSWDWKAR